jgi:hypothetical protein
MESLQFLPTLFHSSEILHAESLGFRSVDLRFRAFSFFCEITIMLKVFFTSLKSAREDKNSALVHGGYTLVSRSFHCVTK